MMPIPVESQAPILPPAYHRAQACGKHALHIDALTPVRCLHLLAFCRLAGGAPGASAVFAALAEPRPGGAPRTYSEAPLLLIALLRTLWRLS